MASSQPGKYEDTGKPKKGQVGRQGTSSHEQGSDKGQDRGGGSMRQSENEQKWPPLGTEQ